MKKILIIAIASFSLCSCGIYKKYQRPESVAVDSLYRGATADTATIATMSWRELFSDELLQQLIEEGIVNNTDIRVARLRVDQALSALKSARLAYVPSLGVNAQGNYSAIPNSSQTSKTYQLALSANWEVDIFGKLTNAKRGSEAALMQSEAYHQAVQTQLVATIANSYYTLLMLDSQVAISQQTVINWTETVKSMRAMMRAGLTNAAAVSQAEANLLAVQSSLLNLLQQVNAMENSLSTMLGKSAQTVKRGVLGGQQFPAELSAGVPLQLLSNRPDVRSYEYALAGSYYNTNIARAAFYPSISLGGSAGWLNSAGGAVFNPGQLVLSALGSLAQPIFNKGLNKAQLEIARSQQQEAQINFQQSILDAGAEVNDALVMWQTAREQIIIEQARVDALNTTVKSTKLLMQHGNTTYLEVLTAQQTLLSAELSLVNSRFNEIQGVVSLYHAVGGGVE